MKRIICVFMIISSLFIFLGCDGESAVAPEVNLGDQGERSLAKKPAANLIGTMDLDYTFGDWPEEPVWVGTVTFEEYGVYGIRFFHLSPSKGFSQASPFEEYFEIYDQNNKDVVYLGGPDVGVTTVANKPPEPCKYRMNGEVDFAAAPFEQWLGRHVHMSGVITFQVLETPDGPVVAPATAPGALRIN